MSGVSTGILGPRLVIGNWRREPVLSAAVCEPENVTAISDTAGHRVSLSTMLREERDLKARGLSVAPTRGLARKALGAGPGRCERTLGWYLNIHIGGAFPRVVVVERHHSSCGHRVTPATSSASLCKTIRSQ